MPVTYYCILKQSTVLKNCTLRPPTRFLTNLYVPSGPPWSFSCRDAQLLMRFVVFVSDHDSIILSIL